MRGIPDWETGSRFPRRISPAHAGNTGGGLPPILTGADQPRTCGEYPRTRLRRGRLPGSAPHMRGILNPVVLLSRRAGISPAHAGNTEKTELEGLKVKGSAPHMRGIRRLSQRNPGNPRISPAHAGNTHSSEPGCTTARDQPRTCGEYLPSQIPPSLQYGSAPHMRGIHFDYGGPRPIKRISPAHAGNTS
mgnify:CR=1 FL=1